MSARKTPFGRTSLPARTTPGNRLGGVLLVAMAALLTGCSAGPAKSGVAADSERGGAESAATNPSRGTGIIDRVETRSGQVEAVAGLPTVVPVSITGQPPRSGVVPARLDDGTAVAATLLWLTAEAAASSRWIQTLEWNALPATAGIDPQIPGRWVVLLELPEHAAGQTLWLDQQRRPVRWLPAPEHPGDAATGPRPEPWASPLPAETLRSASLRDELTAMRADPFSAWRAELALDVLAEPESSQVGTTSADGAAGRCLAVLQDFQRARWQAALTSAWRLDPRLNAALREALVPCVRTGPHTWLPAWGAAEEADELDRLADDLLSDRFDDSEKARRVQRWLDEQNRAVAWVIDDAGGTVMPVDQLIGGPRIGVANLRPVASLAWADTPVGPSVADAPPFGVGAVTIPLEHASSGQAQVHCGQWAMQVEFSPRPVTVRPPGLSIGPFAANWTARSWLDQNAGLDAPEPPGFRTLGQIFPRPQADGTTAWVLIIDCAAPAESSGDEVRVWLGPLGASTSVWSASPVSGARTISGVPPLDSAVARAGDGAWRLEFVLPASAVSAEGKLRLGVARFREGSPISAWPRRMVPWQSEPGRVLADVSQWMDVLRAQPMPPDPLSIE